MLQDRTLGLQSAKSANRKLITAEMRTRSKGTEEMNIVSPNNDVVNEYGNFEVARHMGHTESVISSLAV